MSARMRITRGKTGSRRAHHKLEEPRLSRDTETGNTHLRHHVDMETGMYRGKKIFDVVEEAPKEKKADPTPEENKDDDKFEDVKEDIENFTPKNSGIEASKARADQKSGELKGKVPPQAGAVQAPLRQSNKEK